MKIYGYLIQYFDHTDSESHKSYGLVPATSMSDATAKVEDEYDFDPFMVEELTIVNLMDDEDTAVIDQYQLGFFVDAAKQNGYDADEKED